MKASRKRIGLVVATLLFAAGVESARAAQATGIWSGTVAAVSGNDLALVGVPAHFRLAGSVTEMLSGRSLAATELAPGTSVTLHVGQREADGRFPAVRVLVQAKNPLTVTGTIDRIAADRSQITVNGAEIQIDGHTGFAGRGPSGRLRSARDLRLGATVSAALVPTTVGTLRATEVSTVASSTAPGEDQELKGVVITVTDTAWTIDTTVFAITDQTVFEGEPGVGDVVEVKFHADGSGGFIADRIEKQDDPGMEVEFMGIVEAIGDASWTISGQVVSIDAATQIIGSPQVGDNVEVDAVQAADGSLVARKIKKEDAAVQEVEFSGSVEAIGDASWQISSQTVLVNASTQIEGNPLVGDTVDVKALKAADGTLTATRIKKEDSGNGNGENQGGNNDGDNNAGNNGNGGNDD